MSVQHNADTTFEPLFLLDIHHSGYLGWGVWIHQDAPEHWTAETVERVMRYPSYKMGINLGGQTYEQSPTLSQRIRRWLTTYPDRIFLTGGDYAQLTACVRTGESNLRQIIVGLEETQKALDTRPYIWTMSEPGNFAQLPQVLCDLGYTGAVLRVHGPGQRGSLTTTVDAGSVWWEGPDGSRILALPEYCDDRLALRATVPHSMWMMTRYRNEQLKGGGYTLDNLWEWKNRMAAKGICPVVMSKDDDHNNQPGSDNQCMTSGHLLATDTEGDARFRWVNAEELFAELPEPTIVYRPEPERFETRVNSFCDYGYDANSDWTADLEAESKLRTADFMSVLAAELRCESNIENELQTAWKTHLAAQNHDVSLKSTVQLYHHLQYEAQRMAERARDGALQSIVPKINTQDVNNETTGAIVVFNPLGHARHDYATVTLPAEVIEQSRLHDGRTAVPWEVIDREAELVTMGFVAEVPSLGYRTYHVQPGASNTDGDEIEVHDLTVRTSEYTIRFRLEGGIEKLIPAGRQSSIIQHGTTCLAGNIGGTPWQSAGTLSIKRDGLSVVAREHGMMGKTHTYEIVYRMTPAVPYIMLSIRLAAHFVGPGIRETLGDPERKVEYMTRLAEDMNPLTCMRKQPMLVGPYDPKFDPIFAALYWVDYSSPEAGLAILNRGAIGQRWDATQNEVGTILAFGGTRGAWQDIALLPHSGDSQTARIHQSGLGYSVPFHCVYEPAHDGMLPAQFSLVAVEPETVTVSSAFRREEQSYIRVWEHTGEAASVRFMRDGHLLPVHRVSLDLREIDGGQKLNPRQIGTFRLG